MVVGSWWWCVVGALLVGGVGVELVCGGAANM